LLPLHAALGNLSPKPSAMSPLEDAGLKDIFVLHPNCPDETFLGASAC
jgi:hypothetical protein